MVVLLPVVAYIWDLWDVAVSGGSGRWLKNRMTSQEEVESTLRWVADEQTVHETAPFGDNLLTVSDAAAAQAHRVRMVGDYKKKVEKMKDDPKGRDMSVHEAYEALQEVASKRMHCLEDVKQIASLEPLFGKLTTEFAQKATQLVEAEAARAAGPGQQPKVGEGVARAAQNCILAVRANWCWISKLVKCADTHLEHVSDYHQFFHTAAEYNEWMPADLDKATAKVATQEKTAATQEEADRLHTDLKEVLTMFLHWHGKVETLFDKSRKIIPVHLRAKKLDYFRPVNTLCDYKTKDITVREGEELTLLDNADSQSWKVRNLSNTTAQVPAVILVIPGPEPAAVKAAGNLRLQLLGIWTFNVKRIGKSLIWFMILCNPNWTDDQIKKLKAMPRAQKDEVRRTLTFIEETMAPYWAEYGGYKELHKRVDTLRAILDQQGPAADHDAEFSNALVSKFNTTEDLLKRYKDLWTHWDTFRIVVEACQAPEFLLIVERWQQLKYLGMDELRNRWHTGFGFSGEDQDEFMEWLERWMTMTTITTEVGRSQAPPLEASVTGSDVAPRDRGGLWVAPDARRAKMEQGVMESTDVVGGEGPGLSGGTESVDGSGFSRTTVTEVTRTQHGGPTVTKTERVSSEKGGPARGVTLTTTDLLGGAPAGGSSSTVVTSEVTTGEPGAELRGQDAGWSQTTVTRVSTEGGLLQSMPPTSGSMTQTLTQERTLTPGQQVTMGEGEGSFGEGEGSYGEGMYTTTTTTTKTTRTSGGGGTSTQGFSETMAGGGDFIERKATRVEGLEGAPGSSGYSEITQTTRTQGMGGDTEVTSHGEGSFGSGYSETSSQRVNEMVEQTTMETGGSIETATSEQVTTAEQEERQTFVITGVVDPATEKEITMQQAVLKGIINSATGCYVNTKTGESWPIPVAMNAGFIKVEYTTTKKSAEKRRDVGLITIKTQRESRPYTVKAVVDAKTERRLTVDEAIAAGLLDQQNGTYYNGADDYTMSLADAIDSNLLLVEYDKTAEVGEPEVVTKTYAIHSVVDQRAKKTVSFSQAIRKGLLDRETGAYYHNITGEYTYVGDAIKRGFIKATIVKDPNSLDIDPENKLVVEQLQNIRKKLLNPMKALATLRKAAAAADAGK